MEIGRTKAENPLYSRVLYPMNHIIIYMYVVHNVWKIDGEGEFSGTSW